MSAISIMPCLDLQDGRIVKGVHFVGLKDAGDPVQAAEAYAADGAKELALLDIAASEDNRPTTLAVVERIGSIEGITLTVGGGIASVDDARVVLDAGADRISVSSAAIRNRPLISQVADAFGSSRIVVAIDVEQSEAMRSGYEVVIDGGRTATGIDAIDWAQEVERLGASMILSTSKSMDGAKQGYDTLLIQRLKEHVALPIVASGGAGRLEHFLEAAQAGADLLLAASVFHFGDIRISELRSYLAQHGYEVN